MDTRLFDYALPLERIAQTPIEPRDQAKLLVVGRSSGALLDRHVCDLPDFLRANDLLVFNDSRVFKARLIVRDERRAYELFLLRPTDINPHATAWIALAKPGKKLQAGHRVTVDGAPWLVVEKRTDGTVVVDTRLPLADVFALTEHVGQVPLPPYVKTSIDAQRYQTIYAQKTGSVAAPTAGFHFTQDLFARLDEKKIRRAFVTLHVGLGTFRPMQTDTIEEHVMHEEWIDVPSTAIGAIDAAKKNGGRVIAVGTTTARALESAAQQTEDGRLQPYRGFTDIFITPGYPFRAIDGLLTNFHLPKSTLLVLVSAFAGREKILNAYQHAIENTYRFYSFGDAMLII